ncbi:helix-turn-helix domain-containing protein [bacterium]|nr:helix-turn-helix domain-containing protein [bacterium]
MTNNKQTLKFLNIDQLTELLAIKKSTLYSYIHQGIVPHYKINGGRVIFDQVEILEWVKQYHKSGRKKRAVDIEIR